MTRLEFTRYIFEGEQWTPTTLAAFRMGQAGMIPKCVQAFEQEALKPDGIIEYEQDEPLFAWCRP